MSRSVIRDVLSIYIPAFFIMTGISIISPILPIYAKTFQTTYTLATLTISIYAVARLIADIPVGAMGDMWGRRRVLLAGTIIITVSALLCATARSIWELLAYRFLQGFGSAMWMTMRQTMLQDILKPEERGRIMGYFQAFILLGSTMGPSIGGILAEIYDIRAPFYAYSAMAFIGFTLSYLFIEETADKAMGGGRHGNKDKLNMKMALELIKNQSYMAACIATLTMLLTRAGLRNTLIPLYAEQLGLQPDQVGYAITLSNLANLAITIPAGYALDHYGRKKVIVASLAASTISTLYFTITKDYNTILLACTILGLTTGAGGQAPIAMASDASIEYPHGIAMGIYRLFGDIGFIIGPIAIGIIADHMGLQYGFHFTATIIAASTIYIQIIGKETLKRDEEGKTLKPNKTKQ